MKCQILFSEKKINKKNISKLSSAELAQKLVKVNQIYCSILYSSKILIRVFYVTYFQFTLQ